MTRRVKRPQGRPPAAGVTRSAAIYIRCTPEERDSLNAAARRAGSPLGAWLRTMGLREAATGGPRDP